jgi:hypothetical protein
LLFASIVFTSCKSTSPAIYCQFPYGPQLPIIPPPVPGQIQGLVKDEAGNPLSDVAIVLAFDTVSRTNAVGSFSYTIAATQNSAQSVYFIAQGKRKEVRSYHPVMQPADFEVVMRNPPCCCNSVFDSSQTDSLWVQFPEGAMQLFANDLLKSDQFLQQIVQRPNDRLSIQLFTAQLKPQQKLGEKRIKLFGADVRERIGISGDRINMDLIQNEFKAGWMLLKISTKK